MPMLFISIAPLCQYRAYHYDQEKCADTKCKYAIYRDFTPRRHISLVFLAFKSTDLASMHLIARWRFHLGT